MKIMVRGKVAIGRPARIDDVGKAQLMSQVEEARRAKKAMSTTTFRSQFETQLKESMKRAYRSDMICPQSN